MNAYTRELIEELLKAGDELAFVFIGDHDECDRVDCPECKALTNWANVSIRGGGLLMATKGDR